MNVFGNKLQKEFGKILTINIIPSNWKRSINIFVFNRMTIRLFNKTGKFVLESIKPLTNIIEHEIRPTISSSSSASLRPVLSS